MKIQIQLDKYSNIGSLVSSEPFLLVGNETLEIEFIGADNDILLVNLKNSDMSRQILVYNSTFSIPKDFIFEGEIELIVSQYNTALYRKWHCEPIKIIKPQEDFFNGYSVIQELKIETMDLKSKILFLEEIITDLRKQVNQLWQMNET